MQNTWAIGALGSNRIHTPLRIANDAGKVSFRFDPIIGYLHNPRELIQCVNLLRGEVKHPPELEFLLNIGAPSKLGHENRFAKLFENVDALVFEVSSARIIEFNGWFLQFQRLKERMAEHGVSDALANDLFKRTDARDEILERMKASGGVERDVIRSAKFYELSSEQAAESLKKLRDSVVDHPVIFVGTVTKDAKGVTIPQRKLLLQAMRKASLETKHAVAIDPTVYADRLGYNRIMKDLGHYNHDAEADVSEVMFADIEKWLEANKLAVWRKTRRLRRIEVRPVKG